MMICRWSLLFMQSCVYLLLCTRVFCVSQTGVETVANSDPNSGGGKP